MMRSNAWAIVLAGGEGTRLRELTTEQGVPWPKQYCSLRGGRSLLQTALCRAARVVPRERTVVVVAKEHRRFWSTDLAGFPARNIIVQPRNRGTSAGILLPLLEVLARDAEAHVVLLPSDHHVAQEDVIAASMRRALDALAGPEARPTLFGIAPDGPETGYGWIVPQATHEARRVARFVEKPEPALAQELLARGAVWNSFLLAATGASLLELCERRLPALLAAFREAFASRADLASRLEDLYAALPASDFSRDVLQGSEEHLRLELVPPCGWTDLGTPDRVVACLASAAAEAPPWHGRCSSGFDLSMAVARCLGRQSRPLEPRERAIFRPARRASTGRDRSRPRVIGSRSACPGTLTAHARSCAACGRKSTNQWPLEQSEDTDMKVEECMTTTVFSCGPETNLEQAARLMWEYDCGVLPVVDEQDHVVALLTDRDLCMGAYTQGKTLAELPVANSMSKEVVSCLPSDPVEQAIRVMADHKVRRMPVVDASGELRGIFSLTDAFLRAASLRDNRLRSNLSAKLVEAMAAICESRGARDELQPAPAPARPTATGSVART